VFILDWDVHHGNGTQEIFEEDPAVFFASLHRFPFYPGTGAADETGRGAGRGFTLNVPMRAGWGDEEWLEAVRTRAIPAARAFAPDFVLVSAGFDAEARDPLGGMRVTPSGFAEMAREILDFAQGACEGRVVAALEGGYDLGALRESVRAVAHAFAGSAR
jgi:acetoin utilization deacetylase AcuC-like enzyme